ncbi:MerR family transcriptional regulator [Rhodoferax sp.]|uniref:MerR family transcriptional regulator n=1 Tax=Rhodoferax sp. TaxID=50421 RepID=UPI0025E7F8E8|nr:MerR family transcriptional regulator [Rhodoferax sp.]
MENSLPQIPAKRYFTIGEVGELCGVKPHVLRYWEQEFTQLRPMKRRGNRRYYQHHEVLMIRRIRDLLYDQGFTISGARNKMQELLQAGSDVRHPADFSTDLPAELPEDIIVRQANVGLASSGPDAVSLESWTQVRQELREIRSLLALDF